MSAPSTATAVLEKPAANKLDPSKQKTLTKSIAISGKGLFTAEEATLCIHPQPPGTGIAFRRKDLPSEPLIPADLDHVVSTPRCTILGNGKATIHTVEHVLSALKALGIDNALLELEGPEIPIMDGSARDFVDSILKAGISEQQEGKKVFTLKSPVTWSQGEVHLVAIPSDTLKISYTLQFPNSEILHAQYFSATVDPEYFICEISSCRTFCIYEEIAPLIDSGMIKGGGLDNAIIIKNDVVVNPDGVRFSDEMVRHKILDLIGDLSLIPVSFTAHIIAIRSGHASNVAFSRELWKELAKEKS